jgi:citrate lyase subunit alpha/citrate CoA-transferase
VVDRVTTITTPGETVDVLVTEAGVAVNPRRADLRGPLVDAGIEVVPIERLRDLAAASATRAHVGRAEGRVVAVVEYRDGTVIDVVRAVA